MENKRAAYKFSLFGEQRKHMILFHLAAYASIITAFGLLVLFSYWLFWPYKPIVIQEPIKIMNPGKIVYAGKPLIYEMDMDKRMAAPCTITKQLINGVIITSSPIIGNMPVGKTKKNYSWRIPEYAETDQFIMKWTATYSVNPIRNITVVAETEPFNVVGND